MGIGYTIKIYVRFLQMYHMNNVYFEMEMTSYKSLFIFSRFFDMLPTEVVIFCARARQGHLTRNIAEELYSIY